MADAAHLAFAESEADYLISCDDSFIKKGNRYSKISIINPIEFCVKGRFTMKTRIDLQGDELIKKAFEILIENLGITETNRFIEAIHKRKIDSVKRHRQWQKKLDKAVFFDEIFK